MPTRRDKRTGNWFFRKWIRLANGRRERISGVPTTIGLPNTKTAAEEAERREIQRVLSGVVLKEVPTFKDFVDRTWWPTYPASVGNRPRTIQEKEIHLRLHLKPALGDVLLSDIRGERVAKLFRSLREKKLSEKTIKNIRTTLAKILASAVEWEVLGAAPRLPKTKPVDSSWDFYTAEESARLFAAAVDDEERAMLVFAVHTGARWGEQRAIEWGDLDWVNRQVIIRKSMPHMTEEVAPTKSGKARRVPMTETLRAALKKVQGLQHLQGGVIFSRRADGGPLTLYAVRERLARASRKAGLREVRWHDLRHSFASQLVSAGVPLVQVMEWLGHSTIAMTMRYAHLAPGTGDAIRALDVLGSQRAAEKSEAAK